MKEIKSFQKNKKFANKKCCEFSIEKNIEIYKKKLK